MENSQTDNSVIKLKMGSEDQYKERAAKYRTSNQYGHMIQKYSVLQNTIKDCQNEGLIS